MWTIAGFAVIKPFGPGRTLQIFQVIETVFSSTNWAGFDPLGENGKTRTFQKLGHKDKDQEPSFQWQGPWLGNQDYLAQHSSYVLIHVIEATQWIATNSTAKTPAYNTYVDDATVAYSKQHGNGQL